jgi:hypothetical protein
MVCDRSVLDLLSDFPSFDRTMNKNAHLICVSGSQPHAYLERFAS